MKTKLMCSKCGFEIKTISAVLIDVCYRKDYTINAYSHNNPVLIEVDRECFNCKIKCILYTCYSCNEEIEISFEQDPHIEDFLIDSDIEHINLKYKNYGNLLDIIKKE